MPSSSTISRAEAIMRRAASVRPRSASSTPWQESATASTAGAPCVMRSTRTTSRQRPLARVTGLGPHSAATGAIGEHGVRAAAISGTARRGQRAIERRLAVADFAEPRERQRVNEVRLGFAGGDRRAPRAPAPPRRRSRRRPADPAVRSAP